MKPILYAQNYLQFAWRCINESSFHLHTKFGQLTCLLTCIVWSPFSLLAASLVTLARPSTSSSLRITDRSFQYAFPRLWNQLLAYLRHPRINVSNSDSPIPTSGTYPIGSIDSPLSSSITLSLFHSRLKTLLLWGTGVYSSFLSPKLQQLKFPPSLRLFICLRRLLPCLKTLN